MYVRVVQMMFVTLPTTTTTPPPAAATSPPPPTVHCVPNPPTQSSSIHDGL